MVQIKNTPKKDLKVKAAKLNAKVNPQDTTKGIYADDLGDDANLNVKVEEQDEVELQNAINVLMKEEMKVKAEVRRKAKLAAEAKKSSEEKKRLEME